MTSIRTETRTFRPGELGTLVVPARGGEAPDGDMPHLPTPVDGENGPEASPAATETLTGAAHVLLSARSPRA